jgi:hypothetical protein
MKKIILFIFLLAVLPQILAININVEKQSSDETMIAELNEPVVFNLKITNYGESDNFQFYNLLGFEMYPKGTVSIKKGETKNVEIKIIPIGEFNYRGAYTFSYFIRGQDSSEIEKEMTFKIVNLEDAFEIGSGEIDLESNSIEIYIHNKMNFDFQEIHTKFSSAFFNFEEDFSLEPNKRKNFDVQLNKEDFKKLMAGFYTLNAEVTVENKKADIEGTIKFAEKDLVTTTKKEYGFFISTEIVKKENEGNVLAKSETVLKKNIISRLFTSFSPEPDIVEREGLKVYYTWDREIKPGESLEITVKTNWFLPLVVIFFIIAIVILVKQYSKANMVLRKKISFVRTKGGEFALKVSILVSAKKYVERISIIDRLPALVKVHERFGGENPVRIDEKNRRIEWGFEKLEAGETRLLSYIIYSKIGVLGKFALPSATAVYEKEGEIHESESNRAFFVAEQKKSEIED